MGALFGSALQVGGAVSPYPQDWMAFKALDIS